MNGSAAADGWWCQLSYNSFGDFCFSQMSSHHFVWMSPARQVIFLMLDYLLSSSSRCWCWRTLVIVPSRRLFGRPESACWTSTSFRWLQRWVSSDSGGTGLLAGRILAGQLRERWLRLQRVEQWFHSMSATSYRRSTGRVGGPSKNRVFEGQNRYDDDIPFRRPSAIRVISFAQRAIPLRSRLVGWSESVRHRAKCW